VLSALPSFAMPIPKGTLVRMDRPRRYMFWNASATFSSRDCLVSWEIACQLRFEGILGLIDLGTQNTFLLLKSVYRLLMAEKNSWTVWIQLWYLRGGLRPATPLWRSFADLIPLLRPITSVRVGDGNTTSFWMDNWTSTVPLHATLPFAFSHYLDAEATVAASTRAGAAALDRHDRVSPPLWRTSPCLKTTSRATVPRLCRTDVCLLGLAHRFQDKQCIPPPSQLGLRPTSL
jgi:hypothetical protein